jgi:hypothetical protein
LKFQKGGLDTPLDPITRALDEQNNVLGKARNEYLLKEAERKHFEASLVKVAEGRSHAEKLVNAQATKDWVTFQKELARLESVYEFQKLRFEIMDKEWLAQYASMKLDERAIKRGVGA